VADDLAERYLGEKKGYFSLVKPSEAKAALQQAAEEGGELIAPTMGKPKSKEERLILDDFMVEEETGEVTLCPKREAPCEIRRGKEEGWRIYFDPAMCADCDHRDYCTVGFNDNRIIEYLPKQLRLSQRRVAEESEEFREKYRWWSGIEAVNAKLKRRMGLGRLRVRGLARVRLAVMLKVLGWKNHHSDSNSSLRRSDRLYNG
jgi:hypothetical protein